MATIIDQAMANPAFMPVVIAGIAGAGAILFYKNFVQENDEPDEIDTEGFENRITSIFTDATDAQGAKVGDYIKQRSTSNTPRMVGYATKAKDHSVNVQRYDEEDEEWVSESVEGTTYKVIEGSNSLNPVGKLFWGLKKFVNNFADLEETYDVPTKLIHTGDDFIWFDPEAHFIKYNGVKRHMSPEGMGRVWESSFAGLHENYLDTLQDIPETYSVLNNRIAGQLHVDNNKSENIRDFKKQEEREEKDIE